MLQRVPQDNTHPCRRTSRAAALPHTTPTHTTLMDWLEALKMYKRLKLTFHSSTTALNNKYIHTAWYATF